MQEHYSASGERRSGLTGNRVKAIDRGSEKPQQIKMSDREHNI